MKSNPSRRPDPSKMSPEERARYEAYVQRRRKEAENARLEEERRKKAEAARKKRQRKQRAKYFRARLILFLVVLIVVALLVGLGFLLFFHHTPDAPDNTGKITYTYGGKTVRVADAADTVTVDGVYLCFGDLAEYVGMAETGSANGMKFVFPSDSATSVGNGDEESVIFYTDGANVSINGENVRLEIPNLLRDSEVWVSADFVTLYMDGLSVNYNSAKNVVAVARVRDDTLSTDKDVVYLPVTLKLKAADPLPVLDEDPLVGDVDGETQAEDLNFLTDLSAYEDYMNPTGSQRDSFLILVNTTHTLSSSDVPDDLMDVKATATGKAAQQLRLYAAKSLEALIQEMKAAGFYNMAVYSGYRSYAYQDTLFASYTKNEMAANSALSKEQAETIVLTYSTHPGTSEHQTGLAVDMDTSGAFSTDFEFSDEYKWLEENAWKFGFILRFPKDKTDITTIQFEP